MKPTPAEAALARFGLVTKGNTARAHGWTATSDFESGNGEAVASSERSWCSSTIWLL